MNPRPISSAATRAVCLLGIALSLQANAAGDPFAEGVRTTEPLSAEDQQKTFLVPPEFEVQLVAAEPWMRKPMNMQFDTAGRLWYTESREYPWPTNSQPRDTIRILSDFDANGRAQKMTVFATNLNIPIGLYPFQSAASNGDKKLTWKCIAWSIPNIWLFEDTDGDGVSDKKEFLYGPFDHTRDTHGNQSSFRRGFDGWMYAHHGFNNRSKVTARDGSKVEMDSGNSYRIRLDGSRIEHHTHGQVNPFGLAFDEFGNLYSSDCHSAPTYQLLAGGYYPSFGKPHDGLGFAPVLMEHSHGSTAIDAMFYYADDLWPAEFKDNIFVGNVMTSRINRDRLVFNGSSPRAQELDDFVKTSDPWFRPVDSMLGPDGAFYIADFYNRIIGHYEVPLTHPARDRERGRIWRVIYKGDDGKPRVRPYQLGTGVEALVTELASPNLTRRLLAMNALVDVHGASARPAVLQAVTKAVGAASGDAAADRIATHGLWVLHRLGALDEVLLGAAVNKRGDLVRVHAMRLVAERGREQAIKLKSSGARPLPTALAPLVISSLNHSNALIQRCAAEALAEWPEVEHVKRLVELRQRTPAADTHLIYVARRALRDVLRHQEIFVKTAQQPWTAAESAAIADVALAIHNPGAGAFLVSHLKRHKEPRAVTAKYLQHAARYLPEDQVDDLATFVRESFADDVDFQWGLFKPIIDGLAQRGVAPGFRFKLWGDTLADGLLSSVRRTETDWIALPSEANPESANPWVVQNRRTADNQSADFLCSLPNGEHLVGVLRSKAFTCPEKLTFWMAGHDGFPDKRLQGKNFVQLRHAENHQVLITAPAPRNDIAQRVSWDLRGHAGTQVFIEFVDGDTASAYAWLAVGRFEPAVVALPKVTPKLIDDRLQAVAQIASLTRNDSLEPQLVEALTLRCGPETRAAIGSTLLSLNATKHLPRAAELLNDGSAPSAARLKIAQAIADANTEQGRVVLLNAVISAAERHQPKLAVILAGNKAGAEALLKGAESGKISARLLRDRTVKEKLLAAKPTDAQARVAKLTANLSPLNQELQKMIELRRSAYNPTLASATRGQIAYEKACAGCHQINGKGAVVGPQLDGIGARGLERVLEDIVDPNRNVDGAFRTTMFILNDDDVVSGLFRREEGEQIVYAEPTGKELTIPKKNVKERRQSELSLMPEGLAEGLSSQEFNDLLAFLLSNTGARAH